MSKPLLRLIKGALTLDLNNQSSYYLHEDFTPPAEDTTPLIASGTSANRRGGGTLKGSKSNDRNIAFTVNVRKSSSASITRAVNAIKYFAGLAEPDSPDPLYLEWAADSDVGPRPLWGQGPWRRYEVIYGTVALAPGYLVGNRKDNDVDVTVALVVRPYALGLSQRLASATGGVILDHYGAADGRDRGVVLTGAMTNFATNPVFGHSTYDNGWTAQSSLVVAKNTDPAFLLPGQRACPKLTAQAATNNAYFQSLTLTNATTFILWVIVKLPDGGTPTSSDFQILYSTAQTTTFRNLGNGFWAASASVTGNGSSTGTGIVVKAGRTVYLCYLGASSNTAGNLHFPCWGDLLGHAWTGTAHASTSTRTAARIRLPVAADTFSLAAGALVLAWKPYFDNTFGTDQFIFSCGSTSLRARFESSDDKFYFSDNTNEISSSAQTWAADDVLWLAFVWGPSGLAIYKNGVSIASGATYTPPALPSYVYFLTDDSAANNAYGVLMGAPRLFAQQLTAAEVLADYTNRSAVTADGQRDGSLPCWWDKDGDLTVDNVDDSTRDNFGVCFGIPGSTPADTEYYFEILADGGSSSAFTSDEAYLLSLLVNDYFFPPSSIEMLANNDGTATTSADLGSDVETISVNTSATQPSTADFVIVERPELLYGRQVYLLARLSDAGSNLMLRGLIKYGASQVSDWIAVTADATRRLFIVGPLNFPSKPAIFGDSNSTRQVTATVQMIRSAAGAANVTIDYTLLLPAPLIRVKAPASTSSLDGINSRLRSVRATIEDADTFRDFAEVTGQPMDLEPEKVNTVLMMRGNHGAANDISRTLIFEEVKVTPRYALL